MCEHLQTSARMQRANHHRLTNVWSKLQLVELLDSEFDLCVVIDTDTMAHHRVHKGGVLASGASCRVARSQDGSARQKTRRTMKRRSAVRRHYRRIDFAVWEAMVEADQQLRYLGSLLVLEEAGDLYAGNVKPWTRTNSTCVGVYLTTSVCV